MITRLISKIIGTSNERQIKRLQPIVDAIHLQWGFFIFGICSIIGAVFGLIVMKETRVKAKLKSKNCLGVVPMMNSPLLCALFKHI